MGTAELDYEALVTGDEGVAAGSLVVNRLKFVSVQQHHGVCFVKLARHTVLTSAISFFAITQRRRVVASSLLSSSVKVHIWFVNISSSSFLSCKRRTVLIP